MKKILTVLLTAAMLFTGVTCVFAEEQEFTPATAQTQVNGSVDLVAEVVSTYTIKLPKEIDVTNEEVSVDILAKGDVDGAKKIVISESNAGQNKLADLANKNEAETLTITFGSGIEGKDIAAAYGTAKDTMTISHAALKAGSWKCVLPILIKLENVTKS